MHPVWFDKRAVTNILSFKHVKSQYRITYDSAVSDVITVHREEHGKPDMHFRMHPSGLHYYDPVEEALIFLQTVEENKAKFSKREVEGAATARRLYATLNYPSVPDYKWAVMNHHIWNCPIDVRDIKVATEIWGKNIAVLKGKTVRTKGGPIPAASVIPVPNDFLRLHRDVTLVADIFFVNGHAFFMTFSRKITFTTVAHLVSRKVANVHKFFVEVYTLYRQRGFRITTVLVDGNLLRSSR
jgi:hypothetical protein